MTKQLQNPRYSKVRRTNQPSYPWSTRVFIFRSQIQMNNTKKLYDNNTNIFFFFFYIIIIKVFDEIKAKNKRGEMKMSLKKRKIIREAT